MATRSTHEKFNPLRAALAGAATGATFFVICWIGSFLPIGPATHMYLALFTTAEASSLVALVQGVCWSIVFGFIAAGLFATIYNQLVRLGRG